jgi:hypothetical protein
MPAANVANAGCKRRECRLYTSEIPAAHVANAGCITDPNAGYLSDP